jgi:hypothetical protein
MLTRLVALLCCIAGAAQAASITYARRDDLDLIRLSGMIEKGDATQFELAVDSVPLGHRAVVMLNSPGGQVADAVVIGDSIRRHGFATLVDNAVCSSACGLVWLAGTPRFTAGNARIGFHAAYVGHGAAAQESGPGNALVGAYLNRLGLPDTAVTYLTSAPPDRMEWLRPDAARDVGIEMEDVPHTAP